MGRLPVRCTRPRAGPLAPDVGRGRAEARGGGHDCLSVFPWLASLEQQHGALLCTCTAPVQLPRLVPTCSSAGPNVPDTGQATLVGNEIACSHFQSNFPPRTAPLI